MARTFYLSCGHRAAVLRSRDGMRGFLGRPNYSYAIAMEKFRVAIEAAGDEAIVLDNPAIFGDGQLLPSRGAGDAVHLAFYPPDGLRLLKVVPNILMFAWEFSILRTDAMVFSSHAFASDAAMLGLVDAVFTPSRYAARVLRAATPVPVAVVPAPIAIPDEGRGRGHDAPDRVSLEPLRGLAAVPLAIFPRDQARASAQAFARVVDLAAELVTRRERHPRLTVYLTVLNPHDARKGLREGIEAFCRLAQERDDIVWIIKTGSHDDTAASINTRLFTHQVAREADLAGQYFSDAVLVCNDTLDEGQLRALYANVDFYICTSHAEGQNLPLQEAMAMGVVPVSVAHTAMADYVSRGNAIALPSVEEPLPAAVARKYMLAGATWYATDMRDVYEGLRASLDLPPGGRRALARAAFDTIARDYSGPAVLATLRAALP